MADKWDNKAYEVTPRPCCCCTHVGTKEIASDCLTIAKALREAFELGCNEERERLREGMRIKLAMGKIYDLQDFVDNKTRRSL